MRAIAEGTNSWDSLQQLFMQNVLATGKVDIFQSFHFA